MAKAEWTAGNGTTVTVDGTPDEVARVLSVLSGGATPTPPRNSSTRTLKSEGRQRQRASSPATLICDLVESDFFSTPKELGAIKAALEEQGHFYPATTLSPTLLRLVRQRKLRRLKESKRWVYVT